MRSHEKAFPKNVKRRVPSLTTSCILLIHSADPQSRPAVLTIFWPVRRYVPYFQNLRKTKQFSRCDCIWLSGSLMTPALYKFASFYFERIFDPLGRPSVKTFSNYYFHSCLYVLHLNLNKIGKCSSGSNFCYWRDFGPGQVDHFHPCFVYMQGKVKGR